MSSLRELLGRVGIALTAFVLFGGITELAVRVRAQFRYGSGFFRIEDTYRNNPETGVRELVPGVTTGRINVNSLGFRGPEITIPKPERTTRIAFLGGSTTFCAEVSGDDATWPAVAVDRLRRRLPQRDFDYINAGVPGYTTDSSLRAFDTHVAQYQPDIVVIYHASNDLAHLSALAAARQRIDITHLHDRGMTWIGSYSLLWYLAEKNLRIWQLQRRALRGETRFVPDIASLAQSFESHFRRLVSAARKVAPSVAIATISVRLRREQSAEELAAATASMLYYIPYMTPVALLDALEAYNQVIRRVAVDLDVLLVDAEMAIPGDGVHFVDSVHFTDQGSRRLGEIVAGVLLSGSEKRAEKTNSRASGDAGGRVPPDRLSTRWGIDGSTGELGGL